MKTSTVAGILLASATTVHGGPLAYAACQAGCAGLQVACYAAAGFTFGTVTAGAGTPAAILACNSAFGACYAACVPALVAPTP
ncbi:hypothetical protein JCM10213v2_004527 [Rhodosporidiobolus nylandii]